jgi:uncharacterized membrane protein
MSLAESIVGALSFLPDWLVVLLISFLPFIELRGSLPVAVAVYDMPILEATVLSIFGNMVPVPFVLWYFPRIEAWFRRWPWWDRALDRLFERTRRRARTSISRYGPAFLLVFVAIPFPTTGAWTGALIAYLFDLKRGQSFVVILLGVVVAGVVVAALVEGAMALWWIGLIGLVLLLLAIVAMGWLAERKERPRGTA